ncbi:hypothetical protein JST97_37570 [bacterium]|nr:hypothetical protein [bacterium]
MRYLHVLAMVALSQAAWAGCGPRDVDPSVFGLLIGLVVLFAASGPVIGTLLSEGMLGRRPGAQRWPRILVSLVAGGAAFAFGLAFVGAWAPVFAGIASFCTGLAFARSMAPASQPEFTSSDIGFEAGEPRLP